MFRGFRKALETSDLWLLRKEETTDYNRYKFANKWEEALKEWRSKETAKESDKMPDSSLTVSENNPQILERNGIDNNCDKSESKQQTEVNQPSLQNKKKVTKSKPPLVKTIVKVYGLYILFAQFLMLLYVLLYYLNPCLLWYAYLF